MVSALPEQISSSGSLKQLGNLGFPFETNYGTTSYSFDYTGNRGTGGLHSSLRVN